MTEASITELVDEFYGRVRADGLIGPLFNDVVHDWPDHLARLQAFWSSVMLTSGRYKGRPLPAHLKHADRIERASFDRWLSLWKETTADLFEPPAAAALQEKAGRIGESLQLGIRFAAGNGLN
ncbi:MAG TPA: group III truncated hemoglobin [Sphingomicrobium sp.]|nr:group III truncated hemoglobin [Sphingomicrobium sp.]